jgi:hypothetical protein
VVENVADPGIDLARKFSEQLMLFPHRPKEPPEKKTRAVAHVDPSPRAPVTIVTEKGVTRLSGHTGFLDWLTSPSSGRSAQVVHLSQRSVDWATFVPELLRMGYDLNVTQRGPSFTGLYVRGVGAIGWDEGGRPIPGRSWLGQHVGGLVSHGGDLSAEEHCALALEEIGWIDRVLSEHWPVRLGPSFAATGSRILQALLERPIGCDAHVSALLRADRAVGGGRVETYCPPGSVFCSEAAAPEAGARGAPWEIDLKGAYLEILATGTVPAEYACDAPAARWEEPGQIVTALVRVPEHLRFPPLRYENHAGEPCFPTGAFLGTWPSAELSAAVRAGAELLLVLRVRRFVMRDEFPKFAEGLRLLKDGDDQLLSHAAKAIVVQTVGSWASRPSTQSILVGRLGEAGGAQAAGAEVLRPGIYRVPRERPKYSDREILPASIVVTGTGRGWMALLLHHLSEAGLCPTWLHTDGGECLGDPAGAVARVLLADQRLGLIARLGERERALGGSGRTNALPVNLPAPDRWKIYPVTRSEVYSATRRITTLADGSRKVAAGGISRTLTEVELLEQVRRYGPDGGSSESYWVSKRPRGPGGWTTPPRIEDVDPRHARAVADILRENRL